MYSQESPSWTNELINELDVDFEQQDIIWMSEAEFSSSFSTLSVCMVRENDETLRLKGEFLRSNGSSRAATVERGVKSKFQYEV